MQSRCIYNIPKIAVAITVTLMLAFMPFSVNLNKFMVNLERNEANASPVVFAGAYSFLEEASQAAGFNSVGDFIATGVGITAATTGLNLANSTGVNYGDSATDNLSGLIDSADYPAWDTLSSTEQQSWVSQDNYNAAKFNTIVSSMGLAQDYENYMQTWGSFTPGEYTFSTDSLTQLGLIGEVGAAFIDGYSKPLEAILGMFNRTDMQQAADYYMGKSDYTIFDATEIENWPSGVPKSFYMNQGNEYQLFKSGNRMFRARTNNVVYWVLMGNDTNSRVIAYAFSNNNFTWSTDGVSYNDASVGTFNGTNYYFVRFSTSVSIYNDVTSNFQLNFLWTYQQWNDFQNAIPYILNNGADFGGYEPIPDYPEQQIENNEINNINIYFPTGGINENTNWSDLTTGSGTPEVNLDTVIALLQHIDSDLHNLDIPGEPDLQPIISLIQHIDSDLHKFSFTSMGELKVTDTAAWTTLDNIYTRLGQILSVLNGLHDAADAPDLIGEFDFEELENKVPDLLETISDLAPFGSILLLSEMYSIMANFTVIEHPQMMFPFEFGGLDGTRELIIDLSWMDDIKPLINFFCIGMLIIAIANATIRIVEIEAAS